MFSQTSPPYLSWVYQGQIQKLNMWKQKMCLHGQTPTSLIPDYPVWEQSANEWDYDLPLHIRQLRPRVAPRLFPTLPAAHTQATYPSLPVGSSEELQRANTTPICGCIPESIPAQPSQALKSHVSLKVTPCQLSRTRVKGNLPVRVNLHRTWHRSPVLLWFSLSQ